ncbi:2-dehydro-3-deoxygalactonokinase [Polymorphobacter multimanifer]|uniref:2-dehydro-3-deoxygalactonokinase n=1 Tax=Polymorphobacter multimanifer TaxID=1070431 RepID=A0A841LD84_9SPHN|nr:2-dehydro-3-deoxygalactonokinase [Polymorphobacter multimanifer]MBB6227775.1 2-dehydro-3-deoxygalactonokinase [Polymorphobacter multimanifer]
MHWRDGYIAVDWGTTNRRAWHVAPDGQIVAQFDDDIGIMAVPPGRFEQAAAEVRTRLGDLPMLLGGMVGSNRGWREAPYASAPAGMETVAKNILWIESGRTGIVPGISQQGISQQGAAGADVMRGEEVQVFGAIAAGLMAPDGLVCHPGTHAKWIRIAQRQITMFRTMMTGELFALLSRHSILAAQLEADVTAGEAFHAGVDEALAGGDVLSGLFRIRARHLLGEEKRSGEGASYASGLLIGCDVRVGLTLGDARHVTLIGRPDLCALYAAAIARAGRETSMVDGAQAFLAGMHQLVETL